jgi:hypothetical protein
MFRKVSKTTSKKQGYLWMHRGIFLHLMKEQIRLELHMISVIVNKAIYNFIKFDKAQNAERE